MKRSKRVFSGEFTAKVALEAVKAGKRFLNWLSFLRCRQCCTMSMDFIIHRDHKSVYFYCHPLETFL